jgi:D-glycero-alpha-D-manno-heptose-7-phosphate kinase
MKVRAKAPLRLGLAGGGTDVSPYSDQFGGCVLNATINMYAYCTIETGDKVEGITFIAQDLGKEVVLDLDAPVGASGELLIHQAVYARIVRDFCGGKRFPVRVTTYSDAPPGSGLGSSSTMVVAILEAFRCLLSLPLGEYDIAHYAYEIERIDCNLAGGKQDQYAATFGGFNFIEFEADDRVIVNPLRIRSHIVSELESSMILFFTGASRESAKIISDQMHSLDADANGALDAMHLVKKYSFRMKELLLKADIAGIADEFSESWKAKKQTSSSITNPHVDYLENLAMDAGAKSLKVSGAGGGGFMMIFVDPEIKLAVERALAESDGLVYRFQFVNEGAVAWKV